MKNGEITDLLRWQQQGQKSDTIKNVICVGLTGREKNQSLLHRLKLKRIGKDVTCIEGLSLTSSYSCFFENLSSCALILGLNGGKI